MTLKGTNRSELHPEGQGCTSLTRDLLYRSISFFPNGNRPHSHPTYVLQVSRGRNAVVIFNQLGWIEKGTRWLAKVTAIVLVVSVRQYPVDMVPKDRERRSGYNIIKEHVSVSMQEGKWGEKERLLIAMYPRRPVQAFMHNIRIRTYIMPI